MNIQLLTVTPQQKQVLQNLLQLYIYDFSEFVRIDVKANGLYTYKHFDDYFADSNRFAYLIKADGKYIGFVLVRWMEAEGYFSVAEFFVMKRYRRCGIGRAIAMQVFDKHKGRWQIRQMAGNKPAQQFWHSVIEVYTKGRFTEHFVDGRLVQGFDNVEEVST